MEGVQEQVQRLPVDDLKSAEASLATFQNDSVAAVGQDILQGEVGVAPSSLLVNHGPANNLSTYRVGCA